MKRVFFTMLLVLCFGSSTVYSQGQNEAFQLTKKTIIKDHTGNIIKLSACDTFLDSGDWILHPERDEKGTLLYVRLREKTDSEKEMYVKIAKFESGKKEKNRFKKGAFYTRTKGFDYVDIKRTRKKQIEYRKRKDGTIIESKYQITWLDDLTYALKPIARKDGDSQETLYFKIIESKADYYMVKSFGDNRLGGISKVYFKNAK